MQNFVTFGRLLVKTNKIIWIEVNRFFQQNIIAIEITEIFFIRILKWILLEIIRLSVTILLNFIYLQKYFESNFLLQNK